MPIWDVSVRCCALFTFVVYIGLLLWPPRVNAEATPRPRAQYLRTVLEYSTVRSQRRVGIPRLTIPRW